MKNSVSNKKEPPSINESFIDVIDDFNVYRLSEIHALAMVVIFIGSAFCILHFINITVIHLMTASRIFVSAGISGFLAAFVFRKRLKISLLDGLFYNLFGTAPLFLSLFLAINAQCTETLVEIYDIVKVESEGSGFTYDLEENAYQDFWRIRNLSQSEANNRYHRLQLTVCDGILGYKVIKNREMVR